MRVKVQQQHLLREQFWHLIYGKYALGNLRLYALEHGKLLPL